MGWTSSTSRAASPRSSRDVTSSRSRSDAAAAAGVVPVIAAGNDYNDFGAGSCQSPGNSEGAITVGAVEIERQPGASPRRLLVGRPDDDLAPPEARRRGAGSRRPVVDLRRRLGGAVGHEHGRAARRGRGGAAPPAPSVLDGRAGQVRARADRRRLAGRGRAPGRPAVPGRRRRGAPARRSSASLRQRRPRSRSGSSRAARRSTRTVGLDDAGGGAGTLERPRRDARHAPGGPCASSSLRR